MEDGSERHLHGDGDGVTVVGANDAPTAVADKATVQETGPAVTIDVLANDTDPDSARQQDGARGRYHGTLGKVTIAPDGSDVSYDPGAAFQSLGRPRPGDGPTASPTRWRTAQAPPRRRR